MSAATDALARCEADLSLCREGLTQLSAATERYDLSSAALLRLAVEGGEE